MTQNIYDNETFFEGYSRLPRSIYGFEGAPEWPSLRALLPDLHGARIVDLGCGFGWFCRWAREHGAASVLGIDISEKMLARAKAETRDQAISYVRADLERLDLPAVSFHLAYSSLTLHYIEDLAGLVRKTRAALAPGGRLVFSVEHPIFTAPTEPGWLVQPDGRKTWPVDRYLDEGPRTTDWLAEGVVKQHRTLGAYINMLIRSGFTIAHVEEWGPSKEQVAAQPGWAADISWADERERPPFLLVECDAA